MTEDHAGDISVERYKRARAAFRQAGRDLLATPTESKLHALFQYAQDVVMAAQAVADQEEYRRRFPETHDEGCAD